jgi:formylglycine-generating enzyme required for sulfatase activity
MRIFVSYARVDKPYCIQIVDTLDVHDTWYDQRLYAGQNWWKEILRRLDWSEAFVYLLSPDSVASEYCRKEYDLAKSLGKHIVPVLIREDTQLPDYLRSVQYVDLTKGITPDAVKSLLNSVYLAERQKHSVLPVTAVSSDKITPPVINPMNVISLAASAMENGQFDQAVFLLRQAKESGFASKFINIDALLLEAETALERLSYYREAEREYKQISELVRHTRTRKLGLEAFRAFRKDFPDFDPDHLSKVIAEGNSQVYILPTPHTFENPVRPTLPLLEWCDVPAGLVLIDEIDNEHHITQRQFPLGGFKISKYPITNNQFTIFRDAQDGYSNTKWWEFSPDAFNWRINNPEPKPARFKGEERPREMVNWYDAIAFCQWLSSHSGIQVSLPTALEWQRAARGDDNRTYPWGNAFDKSRCNTRESDIKMTSLVMRYNNGASPFDVYDMAGNVWEWCLNVKPKPEVGAKPAAPRNTTDISLLGERAVFGGSFVSAYQRSQIAFHYYLDPLCYHATIGFRVVQKS